MSEIFIGQPPDGRVRLQQLLKKDFLSTEDLDEAFQIAKDLKLQIEDIPLRLMDQQIIRSLTVELQKLKDERRVLELEANIHDESDKIKALKEKRNSPYWCEECQEYVTDEE